MYKQLREPTNPKKTPWSMALLMLICFCINFFLLTEYAFGVVITVFSYAGFVLALWAALRTSLFHELYQEDIKPGKAILLSFPFALFFILPLILGGDFFGVFSADTLDKDTLAWMIGFGLVMGFTSEMLVQIFNEECHLQIQALSKFPNDEELTCKEVAIIALIPEKKVQRALGYQTSVPASVAREWLENVKGIKCPPAVKALA